MVISMAVQQKLPVFIEPKGLLISGGDIVMPYETSSNTNLECLPCARLHTHM